MNAQPTVQSPVPVRLRASTESRVLAHEVFCARMLSYFARRYGMEMETAPPVLLAIVHEHTAVELGEDFTDIRSHVDALLEGVGPVGRSSAAETLAVTEAWVILCRLQAGQHRGTLSMRESLAAVLDLLDVAIAKFQASDRLVHGLPEGEARYREALRREGFDVAPYRGADQVGFQRAEVTR